MLWKRDPSAYLRGPGHRNQEEESLIPKRPWGNLPTDAASTQYGLVIDFIVDQRPYTDLWIPMDCICVYIQCFEWKLWPWSAITRFWVWRGTSLTATWRRPIDDWPWSTTLVTGITNILVLLSWMHFTCKALSHDVTIHKISAFIIIFTIQCPEHAARRILLKAHSMNVVFRSWLICCKKGYKCS